MADGSIIIDTRIDTGGVSKGMNAVKAGMARISAQVSKMGDSAKSSFQRQITAITGLYQNYEKQERKVSELKSKLEELSKVRIETEEYKKLKDDIKALEDEFEKVETKQREWLDMGFSIDSAPLQELDKQMDDIWADIDRLQRKQKEIWLKAQSSHLEASSLQCWATRNRVTTSRRRKLCSERSSGKKQQDDRQAVEVTGLQLRSTAGHCLTR